MTANAPSAATAHTHNLRAIVAMLVSQAFFIGSDTVVKLAAEAGMPSGQIMGLRFPMALLLVLVLAWRARVLHHLHLATSKTVVTRAGLEIAIAFTFLGALPHLALGNITVVLQATPLIITALSAVLLAEQVGWRRWTATAVGFAGVVVVARPGGEGLNEWVIVALVCAILIAFRDLVTRRLSPHIPSIVVTLTTTAFVGVAGFAAAPFEEWVVLTWPLVGALAASAILVTGGNYFIIQAFRQGEVSVVSPFRYAVVIWAMMAAYAVWGDLPDSFDLAGGALIVGSGLYTFHRQNISRRRAEREAETPTV